ncbi:hydrogenase [Acidiphilium multivorum]|uniref:hydrogenase n=1 Tax=Acidiphilium multivorum TaxID=62140 RepID=UPI001F4BD2B5|nr:hydrogenase [Acidiphilium multivorum]UNC13190.1 hydrogenase [Acidiphilium multivorum]
MAGSAALARLAAAEGVRELGGDGLEAALAEGTTLVLFTGDPARHREIDDVAVIVPELAKAFAGRFCCAMVDPDRERAAAARFRVVVRPTLVLVHEGAMIGSVARMRSWAEYLEAIGGMLDRIGAPAAAAMEA